MSSGWNLKPSKPRKGEGEEVDGLLTFELLTEDASVREETDEVIADEFAVGLPLSWEST